MKETIHQRNYRLRIQRNDLLLMPVLEGPAKKPSSLLRLANWIIGWFDKRKH